MRSVSAFYFVFVFFFWSHLLFPKVSLSHDRNMTHFFSPPFNSSPPTALMGCDGPLASRPSNCHFSWSLLLQVELSVVNSSRVGGGVGGLEESILEMINWFEQLCFFCRIHRTLQDGVEWATKSNHEILRAAASSAILVFSLKQAQVYEYRETDSPSRGEQSPKSGRKHVFYTELSEKMITHERPRFLFLLAK